MKSIGKYSSSALLAAYMVKLMVVGATMPDAIVAAFLATLVGVNHFVDHIKFKNKIQEQLDRIEKELSENKEELAIHKQEIQAATSYVSSIKIQSSLRVK